MRRFLPERPRTGEALEDLAEEDLAAPLLLRRGNSRGVAMTSVSSPKALSRGGPSVGKRTPGGTLDPWGTTLEGRVTGQSSKPRDSLLGVRRGEWTSGPNAIIWSRNHDDGFGTASEGLSSESLEDFPRGDFNERDGRGERDPVIHYALARRWLMMNDEGETAVLEATKMEMQRELGVPFRDLMILDPALPTAYPSSIFIRPRAIVLNMEHIKLVVTAALVVVLGADAGDARSRRFVSRLKRQLCQRKTRAAADTSAGPFACVGDIVYAASTEDDRFSERSGERSDRIAKPETSRNDEKTLDEEKSTTDLLGLKQTPSDLRVLLLPFELRVVEAALHDVCERLLEETLGLESEAVPVLEKLASRVSAAALEKTRKIKSKMNSLAARVQAAREALERLLQDDSDMAAMCLTKLEDEETEAEENERTKTKTKDEEDDSHDGSDENPNDEKPKISESTLERQRSSSSATTSTPSPASLEAHEGVEALLEAYYMHCDYSFKRLAELRAAVEDTEDLTEISLDSQRNQLIKVDLMLSNGALAVGAFSMVVGIFGMNLPTGLETSREAFSEVLFVSAVACLALFAAVVAVCWRWKLLHA